MRFDLFEGSLGFGRWRMKRVLPVRASLKGASGWFTSGNLCFSGPLVKLSSCTNLLACKFVGSDLNSLVYVP